MTKQFNLMGKTIWVPGAGGMVGSAIVRQLRAMDVTCLATCRQDVDLLDSQQVEQFYGDHRPHGVFLAAGKVGGIHANSTYPADFILQNLSIQNHVIDGAYRHGVEKLLFVGSTCIYPKQCPQPMKEEYLLTGPLEPTNEYYALAKIAGVKLCQAYAKQYGCDFITAMPTNLYGPNDNFHPEKSHVPAALLQRFHQAKVNGDTAVTIWGTGHAYREFLHVDELADACLFLLQNYADTVNIVNIGTGQDISIKDFAFLISEIVGFEGNIIFDTSRPDGMPKKCTDVSRLHALGWHHTMSLRDGLEQYYNWYLENIA